MTVNRSKPDQYQLRFPPGLRDKLKAAADGRGRSMNAEIILRLEESFKGWPKVNIPDRLFERVRQARTDQRIALEREIEALVAEAIERAFPETGAMHRELLDMFYQLLDKAPENKRDELQSAFKSFWTRLTSDTREN